MAGQARHLAGHAARDERPRSLGTPVRLILAAVLVLACPVLMVIFNRWETSLFPAYREFSKSFMGALAAAASIVPFALWDILAVVLVVLFVPLLIHYVRRGRSPLEWLSWALLVASILAFMFVGGWALNHYAPPLSDELGLEVGEYSTDELADATSRYLEDAARLAAEVPRQQDGNLERQDFLELARLAGEAYEPLGGEFEVFRGSRVPVKALLLAGEPLLWSGHVGVFVACTGESGVSLNCAPADMPYTMCHEAAHRLAIASEEEANFAAYLACMASDDVRLRYAGSYNAFAWCLNALLRADSTRAQQVVDEVARAGLEDGVVLVLRDRAATREHYAAYEGPAEELGTAVNDGYLKAFGQAEGVRSYGLVVDYLIAWNEQDLA